MRKHFKPLVAFIVLCFVNFAHAYSPYFTTFQAHIIKPDGLPLEASSVNFRFTVLDTVGTCALYVEDYTNVNMTSSSGIASFSLGSGSRVYPAGAVSMYEVFNNSATSFPCQAGGSYSPGPTDHRQIVMQFNDGSGWQTLSQVAINSVFYSTYATRAESLGAYPASDYLRPTTLPTCTGTQAVTWDGTAFTCMTPSGGGGGGVTTVSGNAPLSVATGSTTPVISITKASSSASGYLSSADWTAFNAKASSVVGAGKLYLGNASGDATGVTLSGDATLATSGVMTLANSGVTAGTYGGASAVPSFTVDAKGRVTSATTSAYQDATNVAKGVVQIGNNITLASGVISVTSSDITNALGYSPASSVSGFTNGGNAFSADATLGATSNFGLKLITNGSARMYLDPAGNIGIGTTTPLATIDVNGDAIVRNSLYILSSASGSAQALADVGRTAYGTRFYPDMVNVVPLSTVGLSGQAGDLFQARNNTGTVLFNVTANGSVGVGTSSPASKLSVVGDINITGNYKVNGVNIGGGSGTVTNVSSANSDIAVATGSTTPVLTLNSGTGGNQIVKLTAAGQYPAIDGSLITNINLAAGVGTSTLPVANGGTGQTSFVDGQLLIGNSSGNTLTKSTLTAGSGINITNGNGSITIAATGAWANQMGNTVFAAPNAATGTPSFRSLVSADLPTVAIAQGGTGQVTANAALNALLPTQATNGGKVLQTDGTNTSWVSPSSSGVNGTIGKLAKFGTTTSVTDSLVSESGSTVTVNGQIVATPVNAGSGTSFNFNGGNMQYTTANCGAMTLSNMVDGGTYSIAVKSTSGSCTFSHSSDSVHYAGGATSVTITSFTVFSFVKMGTDIFVTWVTF